MNDVLEKNEDKIEFRTPSGEKEITSINYALNQLFNTGIEKLSWDRATRVKQSPKDIQYEYDEIDDLDEQIEIDESTSIRNIHEEEIIKRGEVVVILYNLDNGEKELW